jgi:Zn-dependent protease
MTSFKELFARIKKNLRFSRQEWGGIVVAILAAAFIFSFRDWGTEGFNALLGFKNLFLVLLIAAISFFFRLSCQKVYGLAEGHKAEFKVWWTGIVIALVLAFITNGRFPVILAGTMVASFMVKLRLGEFRYGFSTWSNGIIGYWGILGNLILAMLFAFGLYLFPQSYFFHKGLILNLVMAWCSLIPLPQLDGLNIFFASVKLYVLGIVVAGVSTFLLLLQVKWSLILALVAALIYAGVYLVIGSEK